MSTITNTIKAALLLIVAERMSPGILRRATSSQDKAMAAARRCGLTTHRMELRSSGLLGRQRLVPVEVIDWASMAFLLGSVALAVASIVWACLS